MWHQSCMSSISLHFYELLRCNIPYKAAHVTRWEKLLSAEATLLIPNLATTFTIIGNLYVWNVFSPHRVSDVGFYNGKPVKSPNVSSIHLISYRGGQNYEKCSKRWMSWESQSLDGKDSTVAGFLWCGIQTARMSLKRRTLATWHCFTATLKVCQTIMRPTLGGIWHINSTARLYTSRQCIALTLNHPDVHYRVTSDNTQLMIGITLLNTALQCRIY